MSNQLLTTINGRITKLQASERVTKSELSALSREVLQYTLEQWDSQVINRLVSVLTPMNKRTATFYFQAFTPFNVDKESGMFGAIKNKKAKADAIEAIEAFLETDQDIWAWASDNLRVEPKPQDFCANIAKNVKKALESDIDKTAVLNAVFSGGITEEDVMQVLEAMAAKAEIDALEALVAEDAAQAA